MRSSCLRKIRSRASTSDCPITCAGNSCKCKGGRVGKGTNLAVGAAASRLVSLTSSTVRGASRAGAWSRLFRHGGGRRSLLEVRRWPQVVDVGVTVECISLSSGQMGELSPM